MTDNERTLASVGKPRTPPTDFILLRGTRVLMVADDAADRPAATGPLEADGMRVEVTGAAAVTADLIQQGHYEIVLLASHLPKAAALAATRIIREDGRFAELPIVAIATATMKSRMDDYRAAGVDDVVTTPFEPGEPSSIIQKWVTGLGNSDMLPPMLVAQMRESEANLPTGIANLDVRQGLRRMAGMRKLYLNSLRRFAIDESDVTDRLRLTIQAGDLVSAMRIAHSLKGNAGMIEANEVRLVTAQLEEILEDGVSEKGLELVERLEDVLRPLLSALHSWEQAV